MTAKAMEPTTAPAIAPLCDLFPGVTSEAVDDPEDGELVGIRVVNVSVDVAGNKVMVAVSTSVDPSNTRVTSKVDTSGFTAVTAYAVTTESVCTVLHPSTDIAACEPELTLLSPSTDTGPPCARARCPLLAASAQQEKRPTENGESLIMLAAATKGFGGEGRKTLRDEVVVNPEA